ncbi:MULTISPECIES: hypothetical protein [Alicyclobacillus]|uniref:Uncharacterized protein n=3 Tax=Alicyclobacillus tolerans TaxID=90970 RepID=A0A1M6NXU2_9BACL|nr:MULTISPECIES: hypothetical protein [Alicyclobacillus]MDP9729664.1 hypothetical protein [Alicyclobacillus tengchongensis]SHK00513.1 hypothetical protein SAMN05443507_10719 [Alicyclobacillus montanus]
MTTHEIIAACVIAIPVAFAIGRYSSRVAIFHTRTSETLSVPEFLRSKEHQ